MGGRLAESQQILNQALAVAEAEGNGTHESASRLDNAAVPWSSRFCPQGTDKVDSRTLGIRFLARVQGEPAGTLRLRWFADFAKMERVAVKR